MLKKTSTAIQQETSLGGLKSEHFLALAAEAAEKLKWDMVMLLPDKLVVFTEFLWRRMTREEVSITVDGQTAVIQSNDATHKYGHRKRNRKNVDQLMETIENLRPSYSEEQLEEKYASLKASEFYLEELEPEEKKSGLKVFFDSFRILGTPTHGYYITPVLLWINVFYFLLMVVTGTHFLEPDNKSLLDWGANMRPFTLDGESWRLLTSCFVHIGLWHLLLNMYALVYIGALLEPILGSTRFLAAYLIAGIASSLVSLWWYDFTISAGASGAIFGMYGVFLALLATNLMTKSSRKELIASIGIFVLYNLMAGLKPDSGVDNAGHLGGLFSGLLIGWAMVPALKNQENKKLTNITIAALSVFLIISVAVVMRSLPNNYAAYDRTMEQFSVFETRALSVYELPDHTADEKFLSEIRDTGIYYWNENLKLTEELQKMNLPDIFLHRISVLREYCELRLGSYQLLYKAIEEDTDRYDFEIQSYYDQIDAKLRELDD